MKVAMAALLLPIMLARAAAVADPPPPLGSAPEPYRPLHSGGFTGQPAPLSPDPLAAYEFGPGVNATALQIFTVRPVAVTVLFGADHCVGCASLATASPKATITGPVTLRMDFGVELPAWVEVDTTGCNRSRPGAAPIMMGVGEYHTPWQSGAGSWKKAAPKQYGGTLRLETNPELYEGVRFGFFYVGNASAGSPFEPFELGTIRAVVQAKPVNYTGHFHSASDPLLEKVWWTAAWTVRSNLLAKYFGSILMDRGDRESWTGDAHPAQATALVAFHNLDLIRQNLRLTEPVDNGIATYDMYWVLSIIDFYQYTGDKSILELYQSQLLQKLTRAVAEAKDQKTGLRFVGWDDRTGAGFSNSSCVECERDFRFLTLRALNETAHLIVTTNASMAHYLHSEATALTAALRSPMAGGEAWYSGLLLASASDAVNSGIATDAEQAALFERIFSDPINICQLSPFNTYWTLQALGRMGKAEESLFVLRKCWGGMIELGATTFWETFAHAPEHISGDLPPSMTDPAAVNPSFVPWTWSGITSLCHPWAAGPAFWMSQNLLGVKPTAPGFRRFEIKPLLADSLQAVSGVVPSILGVFEVAIDLRLQTANLTVPPGASGRLELRLLCSQHLRTNSVRLNGVSVPQLAALPGVVEAVVVEGIGAGQHTVGWEVDPALAGAVQPPAFPPPTYRAKFLRRDDATRGNWKGKFGAKGHLFFDAPPLAPPPAPPAPPTPASTTCAVVTEAQPNTTNMKPLVCPTTVAKVVFANYGSIVGDCQHGLSTAKCSEDLRAAVSKVCVGSKACALSCTNNGPSRCTVNGKLIKPSPDPCGGVGKHIGLQIQCANAQQDAAVVFSGSTARRPGCDPALSFCNATLPDFVSSVTSAYKRAQKGGFNGSRPDLSDVRALESAKTGGARSIGKLSDVVIIALDVAVPAAHTQSYQLAAYFVDWERQGRVNSITLMNATDYTFPTIAPSQLLRDFGGGAWLVWEATGSVRVRIAHVGGDNTVPDGGGGSDCPISALVWD